jgi:hypothetical protein
MVTRNSSSSKPQRPSATTPEGIENQLIAKAVTLAAKQLDDGTASAQVITHYLKLATQRERLEQQKLINENELLKARVENMADSKKTEELYGKALAAMRQYQGQEVGEGDEYYGD